MSWYFDFNRSDIWSNDRASREGTWIMRSHGIWSGREDLNLRLPAPKAGNPLRDLIYNYLKLLHIFYRLILFALDSMQNMLIMHISNSYR